MREVKYYTLYEANDGTEFDTEEECLAWEKLWDMSNVEMYDQDDCPTRDFEEADKIIVPTSEDWDTLNEYYGDDFILPPSRGTWVFNCREERWEETK